MVVPIPIRRPFLGKFRTSVLKRRYRAIRLVARLLGREGQPIRCRYFGADFTVDPGELIGHGIAINRIEWREITMMLAACREYQPTLFIDVGANIGLYSCILAKAGVVPKTVAFEPDRSNFARLMKNIERNKLIHIIDARPCAVGAARGTAHLQAGPPDNAGLSKIGVQQSETYEVAVASLDEEIPIRHSVVIIKVDVEGYELEVLKGAARLLAENGGYAQIEAHTDARAAEIAEMMSGFGWR